MGIQITNAESVPAVTYDKIHMTKMEIIQPIFTNDSLDPKYEVIICFRHYGVTNGIRYYKNEELNKVALPDFLASAMSDAMAGDITLLTALQNIEIAVASIISDQSGITATVL